MLFKSNGKFIDDVTDSFNRFGLQTKLVERGTTKNIQKFEMYDSIHNSRYVAVAVDKPFGKDAEKDWNNIINKDLIPTILNNNTQATELPASALIVPSKDIDTVERLLKDKGLSPTIYQLFTGYVVAGISKKDTSKIIDEHLLKEKDNKQEEQKEELIQEEVAPQKKADEKVNKDDKNIEKKENIAKQKETTLNNLSNIKENKCNKIIDNKIPKPQNSSIAKKIVVAALLGTALGVGTVSMPDIKEKINNYNMNPEEKLEREVLDNATKRYFDNIKNGFQEDDELLKIIAKNPQLADDYIKELANTPVQTYALKNKSASSDLLKEKALSKDETVRAAVAENPSTPRDVLEKLSKDKSNNVLKALAKNPAISKKLMEDLSNYSGLHNDMLENPALTPDIMRKISIGKNRDCDFNKKYMANPCISIDEIMYNINNPDECVRLGLAANPNTPQNAINQLLEDNSPLVKKEAYKHPNIPVEKLNNLFSEHWIPENDNIIKEAERVAALENPNISSDIKRKALFMDPGKYAKAVANNKSTDPEIINKLKNIAQGKKGLNNLIYSANNIKNDHEKMNTIKYQVDNNKETADKPVRRMMNKEFIQNVYNPYKLIEDMRNRPSKKDKYNLKNNAKTNNPTENNNGYQMIIPNNNNNQYQSILDKSGNAPEYFAKLPLPPLNQNNVSYNPDAEMEALKVADDIITDLMSDILPDIEKSLNSSFVPRNNKNANNSNNITSADAVNNNNNMTNINNINKKPNILDDYLTKKSYDMYENACRKIDDLHKMF